MCPVQHQFGSDCRRLSHDDEIACRRNGNDGDNGIRRHLIVELEQDIFGPPQGMSGISGKTCFAIETPGEAPFRSGRGNNSAQ
jgi:hypothetical protein